MLRPGKSKAVTIQAVPTPAIMLHQRDAGEQQHGVDRRDRNHIGREMRPQLGVAAERDQDEIDERRRDDAGDDDEKRGRERVRIAAAATAVSDGRLGARGSAAAFMTENKIVPAERRGR